MSDPIFLRPALSGSVYAEQVNSAQIQAQAAARERATRVRQEALKDEQAMIVRLEESARVDIRDQDGRNRDSGQDQEPDVAFEEHKHAAESHDDEQGPVTNSEEAFYHIDFTV